MHDLAGATSTATVSIKVTGVNDAPVAHDDAYTLDEDTVLTINGPGLVGNDSDPDHDVLQAVIVNGAAHGKVVIGQNGAFTYTPNENFNGADSFTYRANDGHASSGLATVNFTVNAVNDAPVARDDAFAVNEDTVLRINVANLIANDSDAEGDAISAFVSGPAHGVLSLGAGGSLVYTPARNFHGDDSFQYLATDGTASSGATVFLTVNSVNDRPQANDDHPVTDENTIVFGNVLTNDSDVDGDTLTLATVGHFTTALGAALTLGADGSYVYDPTGSATLQALNAGKTWSTASPTRRSTVTAAASRRISSQR